MQLITPSQEMALNSNNREWRLRLKIYRNNYPNTPIDLTSYVQSVDITADLNSRNLVARVILDNVDFRFTPQNKTSPFNQVNGVYDPLIFPNHRVEIDFGIKNANGIYEYWRMFTGVTGDNIELNTTEGTISLDIRDMSKPVQDAYIYLSLSYDYRVIEEVIQGLLDESFLNINLVYDPTYFLIQHYQVKDMRCWDAIQKLADMMGWILMFDENGVLRLKPVKEAFVPDIVFTEDDIVRQDLSLSDADVRNYIVVRVETPDGIITAEAIDRDSINEFGRRYMQIDRSLASYIWSYDKAYNLARAICRDLAWLPYTDKVEIPLFPPIQLDDIVAIRSSRSSLDERELFKVIAYEHRFSTQEKRTSLTLKKYIPSRQESVTVPNPPTSLTASLISYTINNYLNSGWIGNRKTIYYPRVFFNKPIKNIDGSDLTDLMGYVLLRSRDGVSYLELRYFPAKDANNNDVTSVIDYSAPPGLNYYSLYAINSKGRRSANSSTVSITVPEPLIE